MDFKDWRKTPDRQAKDAEASRVRRALGRQFESYIGQQIREAEERGEFENLPGFGKPLPYLDNNLYAGDKAMGYHLLKSNGYAPREIELAKEIRTETERIEAKLAKIRHQSSTLRKRRVPPFPSEKRAFNATVERIAAEYERTLRELNSKILTLNLSTPPLMHQPTFEVDTLVREFRAACPRFD